MYQTWDQKFTCTKNPNPKKPIWTKFKAKRIRGNEEDHRTQHSRTMTWNNYSQDRSDTQKALVLKLPPADAILSTSDLGYFRMWI